LLLPALLPLHVAFVDPAVIGKSYTFALFDPELLMIRNVDMTVTAESTIVVPDSASYDSLLARWEPARWDTLHAWRLSERIDGQETHTWVDELGQLVEAVSSSGFEIRRTAFEIAFENFQAKSKASDPSTAPDDTGIAHISATAAGVPLPTVELEELRLRVTGVPPGHLHLTDRGQQQSNDTLVVRRELGAANRRVMSRDSVRLLAQYTQPDALVQSTDPRIEAQARQIVGRASGPMRQAPLLNQWVHETIDKQDVTGTLPAVAVLERRRGGSQEHAVLYVALARALGIPARFVAGLVYVQERFYHHAWAEVWVNGWVAVDPTLGQFPADARHVRLTTDGLLGQQTLIKSIGTMRLDVLSIDGDS
jgi:transglutaminase-like putative cysteine protease